MNTEQFYSHQSEPHKGCFLAMRKLLLEFDNEISESIKYSMPCFSLGGKPFCYLWKDKKTQTPYFLIVKGNEIEHSSLISGSRAKMKTFPINPHRDFPMLDILEVLTMARQLY